MHLIEAKISAQLNIVTDPNLGSGFSTTLMSGEFKTECWSYSWSLIR